MAAGDLGYQITSQTKFTRAAADTVNTIPDYHQFQTLIESIPLPDTGSGDTKSSCILVVSEDLTTVPDPVTDLGMSSPQGGEINWSWTITANDGGRPIIQQDVWYRVNGGDPTWLPGNDEPLEPSDNNESLFSITPGQYDGRVTTTNSNGTAETIISNFTVT